MASQILDRITGASDKADAAIARVQVDVQALRDEIQALKDAAVNRPLTAEEDAKMTELENKLDALDPTSPVVLPPEEPPA